MREGLGLVAGRRLDLSELLAECGELHEHIAQKHAANGSGRGRAGGCRGL